MLGHPGSYANKKRKKPVVKQKKAAAEGNAVVKSNPSKRHRDRLNMELDRLTDLLPFGDDIRARLDKLSVLRLSVGYLRVKSYFTANPNVSKSGLMFPGVNGQNGSNGKWAGLSEGEMLLQALNGFVIVVTAEGLVFYVSATIKDYLGFHQSDVVHQSVFELIHTDDRTTFRQQLHFALNPPTGADGEALLGCNKTVTYSPSQLPPENSSFLERDFVCRFRCLLDNSSGFLALKFQGRLKYLHGQDGLRDIEARSRPQLALFSVAMPVNPPSIVEIRAKMLLFQSKHKLDFTPMAMDSRGLSILGYTELELCNKGSGYQFIHAADMMYCAESHIRMIKTGETGMTVLRLLSKSGSWVWVKSNCKIFFKDGRPDFIIAYQRALVHAEGQEYLHQRQMQLPFSATMGEGILYDSGPTVDVSQFQFDQHFGTDTPQSVNPGSLVDCFLKQDSSVYSPAVIAPPSVDKVFTDSRALLSVPGSVWEESGAEPGAVLVKEEAKQSMVSVIDTLGKMAQDGELCSALQDLDIPSAELMEWESTLHRLGQGEEQHAAAAATATAAELDQMLMNNIFDFIEEALFKDGGDGEGLSPEGGGGSCLVASANISGDCHQAAAGGGGNSPDDAFALCEPQIFHPPGPDCAFTPAHATNGLAPAAAAHPLPPPAFGHCPHQPPDATLPPLQRLQLQDIFSQAIELPPLAIPSPANPPAPQDFHPCMQAGHPPTRGALALPGCSVQPQTDAVANVVPSLVPCQDFTSSSSLAPAVAAVPFSAGCYHRSPPLHQEVQPWQQGAPPLPPPSASHAAVVSQNGHGRWPANGQELNHHHVQPGAPGQSSCMFNRHFPRGPVGGEAMALLDSSDLQGADAGSSQSPPQGSCYFPWKQHGEPAIGGVGGVQGSASASPAHTSAHTPTAAPPSNGLLHGHAFGTQRYLEVAIQTQGGTFHRGLESYGHQQGNYKRK